MTGGDASGCRWDRRGMAVAFAVAAAFYALSVCPDVFWGDSAEFGRRAASLDLSPVARGYPLHRLFSWIAGCLAGNPALGANAVSALFGAVSVVLAYETARRISGSRLGAAAAAAALGLGTTFWKFAGEAEVYTLHAAILLGLVLAVLDAHRSAAARWTFGVLLGVSFLHHRITAFAVPGLLVHLALSFRPAHADGGTVRRVRDVALAFAAGLAPFVVLCLVASRTPPADATSAFVWWVRDVFLGGEHNAGHILGSGAKSAAANAAYLVKWIVLEFPGPALVLAGWGLVRVLRAGGALAWLFGLLLPLHLVFPFRYDWTGDQYSFLIPFHVVLAPLVAVGVAALEERGRLRLARTAAAAAAAAPLGVAVLLGATPLGGRLVPGITADARRLLFLPVHLWSPAPRALCEERLSRIPHGARVHADWGDGQVYLYLQEVAGLRNDLEVRIWYGAAPTLLRDGRDEWVSAMPTTVAPPRAIVRLGDAIEPRGEGLWHAKDGPR